MSIQRFTIERPKDSSRSYLDISEDKRGLYVLYTDHAAEVERLTIERDAAVARAERAEEALRSVIGTATHVDAINSAGRYFAAAPDKPQYAALSPEPWGGPEGEKP